MRRALHDHFPGLHELMILYLGYNSRFSSAITPSDGSKIMKPQRSTKPINGEEYVRLIGEFKTALLLAWKEERKVDAIKVGYLIIF